MTRSFGLRAALIMLVLISIAPVFVVVVQASLEEQRGRLARAEASLKSAVDLAAAYQERRVEIQSDDQLREMSLPPEMTLLMADRNGVVLASAGVRPPPVGEALPGDFLQRAVGSGEPWFGRHQGANGSEWLLAIRPVGRDGEGKLFVVGMASLDHVLSPITLRLRAQLGALALITLLGAAVAWAFADRVLLQPMQQLLAQLDLLSQEDVPLNEPPPTARVRELGELNARFHELARRLAERSVQRDGAMGEMTHQKILLESVLASMAEGVLVVDRGGRFIHINEAAGRILGGIRRINQAGRLRDAPQSDWGVFLLDGVTPIPPREWPLQTALEGRAVENFRHLVRGPLSAGEEKIIQGSARPVRTPEGEPAGAVMVFSDATAAWHAEQALRDSERRYRTLFESNPHPMWVFEVASLKFLTVNDAAVAHYGYSRAEFLAMTLDRIRPAEEVEPLRQALHDPQPQGPVRPWRHRLKDGRLIEVEVSTHALEYDGRQARMALVLDVTQRRQAEQALRVLNETLEHRVEERTRELFASNKELESFSYSVSHDLRAPLQVIDGFGKALLTHHAGQLDDKGRHYLNRIRDNTRQMGHLIDDLLSLAQVTRAQLQAERLDLGARAAQVVERLRQRFPEREVGVQIEEALICEADPRLLGVVLQNLLENAWKFTARTPQASVRVGRRPGPQDQPAFYVADNGAGFDMAYADKLFTPFQRLHASSEFEGTGIGLATVHRIVTRHGGRVWAEASPGAGATFLFSFTPGTHP